MAENKSQNTSPTHDAVVKFSTFGGVFTPSILTIFGVIMFMRTNYVIGQAGIYHALIILGISKIITLLTGFSISAIATNTEVKGGGAYYLISRTLGAEFGATIGIALYLAQALSVPFYILGFTEALTKTFPLLAPYFQTTGYITLIVLFSVAFIGADWAIKTQYGIMAILASSIVIFIAGAALNFNSVRFATNWTSGYTDPSFSFWTMFAIFFPAVTGIMAGINMSGNLKDPGRALPRGTFAAIIVGGIIYGLQIVLLGGAAGRQQLIGLPFHSLIDTALFGLGFMIPFGVFCATLSSALGSLIGAPRILQALGQDKVLAPVRPFGKMSRSGEPRRAILLTGAFSLAVLYFTGSGGGGSSLNTIASIVTMLFLCVYGITNLAAFVESFGANPSFRPRFKFFHWSLALAGAFGCIAAAFLIDPVATFGAGGIIMLIFLYVRRFVLKTSFGDARRGFYYARIRNNLFTLAALPVHAKNWRPTILVLTGNPHSRLTLARFAVWMGSGRGIVTMVSILVGDFHALIEKRTAMLETLQEFIKTNRLQAFPEVLVAPDFDTGVSQLLQVASIEPIKPNLVLFGWPTESGRAPQFVRHLKNALLLNMSQVIIRDNGLPDVSQRDKVIDIWWRGRDNGSLMVILAHLLTLSPDWHNASTRIFRVVRTMAAKENAYEQLKSLIEAARLKAKILVLISEKNFGEILSEYSSGSSVIMLGFQIPDESDAVRFQVRTSEMLKGMPTTVLVNSTGEADLTL
jgi:amino acid transporter